MFEFQKTNLTKTKKKMANVNKVMLLGNLTRDPEVRYTPKGTAVTEIGMAVNRVRKGDDGEKIEEVTFIDVTLWGRTAELAGQYLAKGRSVFIEGRLNLETWDDKTTGAKRSKLSVIGENMQFIGGRQDGDKPRQEGKPLSNPDPDPGQAYRDKAGLSPSDDTEEIPF